MSAPRRTSTIPEPAVSDGWREVAVPRPTSMIHGTRAYQKAVADGHLSVFVSPEPHGWHLSMSHRVGILDPFTRKPLPGRIPTWEELRDARYLFCADVPYMAMILPPKDEYVNVHPTTMHLHEIPAEVAR